MNEFSSESIRSKKVKICNVDAVDVEGEANHCLVIRECAKEEETKEVFVVSGQLLIRLSDSSLNPQSVSVCVAPFALTLFRLTTKVTQKLGTANEGQRKRNDH